MVVQTYAKGGLENRSELRRNLPLLVATHICLSLSVGTVIAYTYGIFARPVRQEFGWTGAQYAIPLTAFFYASVVGSILCGLLVDRIGARRVILGSTFLLALGLFAVALLPASLPAFCTAFAILGLVGCGTSPIAYTRPIVAWFDAQRGLALGIALTGVGTGAAILPLLVDSTSAALGWRYAYGLLGTLLLLVSLPIAAFIVRMPPRHNERQTHTLPHSSNTNAWMMTRSFILLCAISLACGVMLTGLIVHFPAILASRGVDPGTGALLTALVGASVIIGRLGIGYLLDRLFGPRVLAVCLLGPVIAALLLSSTASPPAAAVAAILIGVAQGAEVDAIGFLTSRYVSPSHYGQTFGMMFAAFTFGAANGPLLIAVAADRAGDFAGSLIALSGIGIVACTLCLFLPGYSQPEPTPASP